MDSQDRQRLATPARVQIKYDVETEGEEPILELPFVLGVMADLSAQGVKPKAMKERKFAAITAENFTSVMAAVAPRVALRVPNRLTEEADQELNVELFFKTMADFDPGRVAEQVPALNEMLTMRRHLNGLLQKLDGNDDLERLLKEVIDSTDKLQAVAAAKGEAAPAA
jgi:type VI secretion system protein ImpB